MKRLFGLAAFAAALACAPAQAQQINVKIGVLSDMSSLYADLGGAGLGRRREDGGRRLHEGSSRT